MAASYPAAVKSFTAKTDSVDDVMAVDVNELQEELAAVETELGADVAGSAATLLARLARSLDGNGNLNFNAATTLTISSGSITATQNYHLVDTESSAASDDLDTVTAAAAGGFVLHIRPVASARNVVVKHNVGNILCMGGQDITLDLNSDKAELIYDAVLTKWIASGVGAGILAAANTWTGKQVFSSGLGTAITTITTDTTLGVTHQVVEVNCNGGDKDITLPAASGCVGTRYDIVKIDSGAYDVIIGVDPADGDGINGEASYTLSSQWASVSLISTGSGWVILSQPIGAGMTNPMTTAGDLILGGASGTPTRLAIGTNGYVLKSNGTTASWGTVPGSGNMVGPSSSVTDGNLVVFDGTTGLLVKDGGAVPTSSGGGDFLVMQVFS